MTGFFPEVLRAGLVVGVLAVVTPNPADAASAPSSAGAGVRVEEIAPGVYAVVSQDPLGLANHSNAVFIVNDTDVILIDTQFTLARTRDVLAALRTVTDKPVSVLVNTHWHDDHTFGNQVVRDAFPKVEIIAHARTKDDMAGIGVENRAQQVSGGADAVTMFRDAVGKQTSLDGSAMGDDERAAYESTIALAREYLDEMPDFRLTLPTKTFEDQLVLTRGKRTIEIRHVGPGVTPGDAVVYLPKEGVLVAGDIVDNPLPFAYRCNVSGWIAALDAVSALKARVMVPGHGPVMHDNSQAQRLAGLLTSIREQTVAAKARGESLEQARGSVNVGELRGPIVGENKMLAFLFDGFFVGQVVASAYDEVAKK